MDLRLLLMEDGLQDSEKIDNITINMVIYFITNKKQFLISYREL